MTSNDDSYVRSRAPIRFQIKVTHLHLVQFELQLQRLLLGIGETVVGLTSKYSVLQGLGLRLSLKQYKVVLRLAGEGREDGFVGRGAHGNGLVIGGRKARSVVGVVVGKLRGCLARKLAADGSSLGNVVCSTIGHRSRATSAESGEKRGAMIRHRSCGF